MKRAFIVYFNDNTAMVVIQSSIEQVLSSIVPDMVENIVRVDTIPYPVL